MADEVHFAASVPALESTPLFGLGLLGEGTGDVESLYGYFLRLAHAHRLTPKRMVDIVLSGLAAQIPDLRGWRIGWGWDKDAGRDLVSGGFVGLRWATVLGVATGRAGLEDATMHALAEHVSGDLLAGAVRVCLKCLHEDTAGDAMPYERLLWRMKSVTCCPVHRVRLVAPTCGSAASGLRRPFQRVKLSGVCNECGSIGHRCHRFDATAADADEVWRAEQCRKLIAAFPVLRATDPRMAPNCIKAYCRESGALTSLALRSGATISVLSRWINQPGARLSFDQLLDICGTEGLELAALLEGRLEASDAAGLPIAPVRTRRKAAKVDHAAIRAALMAAIDKGESVTNVAETLRVDIATLARHKDLYDAVRDATRQRMAAAVSARQDEAIAKAEAAAVTLLRSERRLTHRNARSTGVHLYPSDVSSAVLAMMRIGLGERRIKLPIAAARMGQPFLRKIEQAVQRVKAATQDRQLRLPLHDG